MSLRVGAAMADITPPLDQTRRAGEKGLATAVIGRFCARAIVCDDGDTRLAVVLLDVCDFYDDVTRGIRERVGRHTDVPPENVMVCSTHVHAAPRVIENDGQIVSDALSEDTRAYLNVLCGQAAGAVFLAESRLRPATARVGEMSVPGIGRPSRIRLKDGRIVSLGNGLGIGDIPPEQVESVSPYDDALRLAVFEDVEGRPICAVGNFGCHNNIALSTTTLNSDFFGWAAERVEAEMGSGFVMAMTPGPEGDVQPLAKIEHRTWDPEKRQVIGLGRGDHLVPPAGEILYRGIKAVWERLEPVKADRVSAASAFPFFPWHRSPTATGRGYIHNRQVAGGRQDARGAVAELQLLRIGDLAVLAVCGEVFQEIAANLRLRSPFRHTWVTALSNDRLLYLMPAWEYRREVASGVGNTQFDQVVTDASAEEIIYASFEGLFAAEGA